MNAPRFSGVALFVATTLLAIAALACALIGETVAAHARHDATRAAGALTVRVTAPGDEDAVARAAAVLADLPGVQFAASMSRARAARLLETAGGGPVDPATLPPVRLIEAARDPEIATDAAIEAALAAAGVRADLFAPPPAPDDDAALATLAGRAGAAAILLALALLFALAARAEGGPAALGADLGAPRGRILAAYGRNAAEFAFIAGALAALATTAGAAGVLTGRPVPVSLGGMVERISAMEAVIVLLLPLATALAAAMGARAGAAGVYDAADRLG